MDNGSIWDLFQNTPNYDGGRSSMGSSVGVGGYFCRWAPSRPWARWAALTTSHLRPDLTVDLESGRTWNNSTSVRFLILPTLRSADFDATWNNLTYVRFLILPRYLTR